MATTMRRTDTDLIRRIGTLPPANDDFFQLVRLLERLSRAHTGDGRVVPVGRDGPPGAEALRFHAVHGSGFPGQAVASIKAEPRPQQRRTDSLNGPSGQHIRPGPEPGPEPDLKPGPGTGTGPDVRFRVAVTFMGLTGPSGVLPNHYSALVQQRLKQRDTAFADFLDLFNHRLISLYYRAWAKYRLVMGEETSESTPDGNPYTRTLQGLSGHGGHDGEGGQQTRLYYAGHFSRRIRTAKTLEALIRDFLKHPVRLQGFVGQWLCIRPADRLRLGGKGSGSNNRLGDGILTGSRVWDIQSKCRIHIGPITAAEHLALLPDTPRLQALKRLIQAYAPGHLDMELRLEIRERRPTDRPQLGCGLRNGWTTWLQSGPPRTRFATMRL